MGNVHHGLVRKPVSIQEAMMIPEAKAAVVKEWKCKKNPAFGRKEGEITV